MQSLTSALVGRNGRKKNEVSFRYRSKFLEHFQARGHSRTWTSLNVNTKSSMGYTSHIYRLEQFYFLYFFFGGGGREVEGKKQTKEKRGNHLRVLRPRLVRKSRES